MACIVADLDAVANAVWPPRRHAAVPRPTSRGSPWRGLHTGLGRVARAPDHLDLHDRLCIVMPCIVKAYVVMADRVMPV